MIGQILLIDDMHPDDLFALPSEDQLGLVFADKPVLFKLGSAEILAEFSRSQRTMTVQLAEITGGGEGVLLNLFQLIRRFARDHAFQKIEWVVYAVTCKNPNFKLREVLERLGFEPTYDDRFGEIYYLVKAVSPG